MFFKLMLGVVVTVGEDAFGKLSVAAGNTWRSWEEVTKATTGSFQGAAAAAACVLLSSLILHFG